MRVSCLDFPVAVEPRQGVDRVPDRVGCVGFVGPVSGGGTAAEFVEVAGECDDGLPGGAAHGVGVVVGVGQVLVGGGAGSGGTDQVGDQCVVEVVGQDEVGLDLVDQVRHFRHLLSPVWGVMRRWCRACGGGP